MSDDAKSELDVPTVIAIAALAWTIANVVHEGLGHGGACLLLGARPTMFNAIFFNYDESSVSGASQRMISAAGSIVNVLVGLPIVLFALPRVRSPHARYFLWLFAAVNLTTAFGYLIYSGVSGIGDWARVIDGAAPAWLFRALLIGPGLFLYFYVAPKLLMPPLEPFLGREPAARESRARRLSLVPYLAGGISLVIAGVLNPLGMKIVLISAVAAGFGGTSLLAWYPAIPRKPLDSTPEVRVGLTRSIPWIAASAINLALFVIVLGPGIGSVPAA